MKKLLILLLCCFMYINNAHSRVCFLTDPNCELSLLSADKNKPIEQEKCPDEFNVSEDERCEARRYTACIDKKSDTTLYKDLGCQESFYDASQFSPDSKYTCSEEVCGCCSKLKCSDKYKNCQASPYQNATCDDDVCEEQHEEYYENGESFKCSSCNCDLERYPYSNANCSYQLEGDKCIGDNGTRWSKCVKKCTYEDQTACEKKVQHSFCEKDEFGCWEVAGCKPTDDGKNRYLYTTSYSAPICLPCDYNDKESCETSLANENRHSACYKRSEICYILICNSTSRSENYDGSSPCDSNAIFTDIDNNGCGICEPKTCPSGTSLDLKHSTCIKENGEYSRAKKIDDYGCKQCVCKEDDANENCTYTKDQIGSGGKGSKCCNGKYTCTSNCKEVTVPDNATVTETCTACGEEVNTAWECNEGYVENNGACVTATCNTGCKTKPEDCYSPLDTRKGSLGWELGDYCNKAGEADCKECVCNAPKECAYTKDQIGSGGTGEQCCDGKYTCTSNCKEVIPPANATGTTPCTACGKEVYTDWKCDEGYKRTKTGCVWDEDEEDEEEDDDDTTYHNCPKGYAWSSVTKECTLLGDYTPTHDQPNTPANNSCSLPFDCSNYGGSSCSNDGCMGVGKRCRINPNCENVYGCMDKYNAEYYSDPNCQGNKGTSKPSGGDTNQQHNPNLGKDLPNGDLNGIRSNNNQTTGTKTWGANLY